MVPDSVILNVIRNGPKKVDEGLNMISRLFYSSNIYWIFMWTMTVYNPIQSFTDLQLCTEVYSVSIQHFCEVDKLDSNSSLNVEEEVKALRGRSRVVSSQKGQGWFPGTLIAT